MYIPKYLEREALDQFMPVYGLAVHSLTSHSHFVVDLSSWHHLALTSIQFEGKRLERRQLKYNNVLQAYVVLEVMLNLSPLP
jgi:hypothetical protein